MTVEIFCNNFDKNNRNPCFLVYFSVLCSCFGENHWQISIKKILSIELLRPGNQN
jgi:hypothetical protein